MAYWAEGETIDYKGKQYNVCSRCSPNVKENPSVLAGKNISGDPFCDACGRRHSSRCEIVKFAGANFNVCGECIEQVHEDPADFLAGKKGTEPQT
jgi:ribosome-binding protein aMBF1 (putative translation factor)